MSKRIVEEAADKVGEWAEESIKAVAKFLKISHDEIREIETTEELQSRIIEKALGYRPPWGVHFSRFTFADTGAGDQYVSPKLREYWGKAEQYAKSQKKSGLLTDDAAFVLGMASMQIPNSAKEMLLNYRINWSREYPKEGEDLIARSYNNRYRDSGLRTVYGKRTNFYEWMYDANPTSADNYGGSPDEIGWNDMWYHNFGGLGLDLGEGDHLNFVQYHPDEYGNLVDQSMGQHFHLAEYFGDARGVIVAPDSERVYAANVLGKRMGQHYTHWHMPKSMIGAVNWNEMDPYDEKTFASIFGNREDVDTFTQYSPDGLYQIDYGSTMPIAAFHIRGHIIKYDDGDVIRRIMLLSEIQNDLGTKGRNQYETVPLVDFSDKNRYPWATSGLSGDLFFGNFTEPDLGGNFDGDADKKAVLKGMGFDEQHADTVAAFDKIFSEKDRQILEALKRIEDKQERQSMMKKYLNPSIRGEERPVTDPALRAYQGMMQSGFVDETLGQDEGIKGLPSKDLIDAKNIRLIKEWESDAMLRIMEYAKRHEVHYIIGLTDDVHFYAMDPEQMGGGRLPFDLFEQGGRAEPKFEHDVIMHTGSRLVWSNKYEKYYLIHDRDVFRYLETHMKTQMQRLEQDDGWEIDPIEDMNQAMRENADLVSNATNDEYISHWEFDDLNHAKKNLINIFAGMWDDYDVEFKLKEFYQAQHRQQDDPDQHNDLHQNLYVDVDRNFINNYYAENKDDIDNFRKEWILSNAREWEREHRFDFHKRQKFVKPERLMYEMYYSKLEDLSGVTPERRFLGGRAKYRETDPNLQFLNKLSLHRWDMHSGNRNRFPAPVLLFDIQRAVDKGEVDINKRTKLRHNKHKDRDREKKDE